MNKMNSVLVFHPGEYIEDELNERGWTQDDLAEILGVTRQTINRVLGGKTSITAEMACKLAAAFSTSANLWLNLQNNYDISLAKKNSNDVKIIKKSALYVKFPVNNIIKRGWIEKSSEIEELEENICNFLSIKTVNDSPEYYAVARKNEECDLGNYWCWLAKVRNLASHVKVNKYKGNVEECIKSLRTLTLHPNLSSDIFKVLNEFGIKLVFVKHLPNSKIDGVATWVSGQPVIGLSLRYPRIDYFWFTLFHELVHIKYEDQCCVDTENTLLLQCEEEIEDRANKEAANYLVPNEKLLGFISRVSPLYYKKKIILFAQSIGIHPGIVVGQLNREREIQYSHHKDLLVSIRNQLLQVSVNDGWVDGE